MAGVDLGPPRRVRRPSLTPLVDVVFLLLVFFMLASRFSVERSISLVPPRPAAEGESYEGAPRFVTVAAEGLKLNGAPVTLDALVTELIPLMPDRNAAVILQSAESATLQELVIVMDTLAGAGMTTLVIAE